MRPLDSSKIPSGTALTDMSYFNPSEAPAVHIEPLPASTTAALVEFKPVSSQHFTRESLVVTAWVPGKDMETVGSDPDSWRENNCEDCQFYTDELEIDVQEVEIYSSQHDCDVELRGTAYAYSPCPCYNGGIDDVSFPCPQGYDGPGEEDSDVKLSTEYMRYTVAYHKGDVWRDYASQQAIAFSDDGVQGTDPYPAVNTFNDNSICWGDNTQAESLLQCADTYSSSPANEDLVSFHQHQRNTEKCESDDTCISIAGAFKVSDYNHRAKALVCAAARLHQNAFVLLASSGCRIYEGVATVEAMLYPNVAVDDDTILDVWATEPTSVGKRLLFYSYPVNDEDNGGSHLFLGQVPQDFNLEPCESPQLPSSEPVEPVNNSSPASSVC